MRIYIEYGCPKRRWSMSKPAETKKGFWYKGQIQLHIITPELDCVSMKQRLEVCDDCPINGKIRASSVTLWDTEESWEPLGRYR